VAILLGVGVWEILGRAHVTFLVPPFSDIVTAWVRIAGTHKFADSVILSLQAYAIGQSIAVVAGLLLGLLMGRFRAVEYFFEPWVNLFMAAPMSALVPVIMAFAGIGNTSIVVTVFMFSFFIIVVDTMAGVKHVSPALKEMGRSFGATPLQMMRKILFRAAMPEILTGIRLGVVRGVKGMIVGFGYLITTYTYAFAMAELYAVIFTVLALSMTLSSAVGLIERRVVFWGRR
jgi:NitT/TauT family transport system permease protein